jgi:hypothetical protein
MPMTDPLRAADTGPAPVRPESVAALLAGLWRSMLAEIGGTAELLATESRLAAMSIAAMLGLAVAAVAFVLATWLALAAALSVWLVSLGLAPAAVLLGVAGANLLLAWLAWLTIRGLSRNLLFRRTRDRLRPGNDMPQQEAGAHAVADARRA